MEPPVAMEKRAQSGGKLVSPSSLRNCAPIGDVLTGIVPKAARVLEIASGTGQHGAHMCAQRRDLHWQFSDIDSNSRASQNAYAQEFPDQMGAALSIDVMQANWWASLSGINVIYCANMIHIAPWDAALGLAKGAGMLLPRGGIVCLYGPFLTPENNARSNLEFDRSLQSRNPAWGVRSLESVKHIFADSKLDFTQAIDMPRNNSLLVFQKHS